MSGCGDMVYIMKWIKTLLSKCGFYMHDFGPWELLPVMPDGFRQYKRKCRFCGSTDIDSYPPTGISYKLFGATCNQVMAYKKRNPT